MNNASAIAQSCRYPATGQKNRSAENADVGGEFDAMNLWRYSDPDLESSVSIGFRSV